MAVADNRHPPRRIPWLLEPHPVARGPDMAQRVARARLTLLKRRESRWPWLPLCLLLATALTAGGHAPRALADAAGARGAVPDFDRVGAGSLYLNGAEAPRLATDVRITVSGLVSRVSVRQSFENPGAEWAEGVYVFPLPDRAAVDRLRMQVGERTIEGEIREREAAKKIYAQARESGQRASLVEQERPNLFTTSVANIGPGESITVEIGYLETLEYDAGRFSLRFPMTITPRYVPGEHGPAAEPRFVSAVDMRFGDRSTDAARMPPQFVAGDFPGNERRVSLVVEIDAGFPLDGIESRYHPVSVDDLGDRYSIELAAENPPADRDFELVWRPIIDQEPGSAVFTETIGGERYALLLLMPPALEAPRIVQPREMIFVIDTSGSMAGDSIEQAKAALEMALVRLQPGDRFNVVQFNSWTESLFLEPQPVTEQSCANALGYVRALEADGGTEMLPALELALEGAAPPGHLRQIVFITDGSVGNEEELFSLIHARLGDARLFTVGIGSAPNGWFMRKAARFGRGTFTLIGSQAEVGTEMGALFVKLESPVLTDLAIDWPGKAAPEVWPARARDVYAGEPLVMTARLTQPEGMISLSGKALGGQWLRQHELKAGPEHPGIAALWARGRIESLMDQRIAGADQDAIRAQVVETALRHGLVSRYTSLVAVDRTPARPAGLGLSRKPVPSLLPHGVDASMLAGYPRTATPATLHFLVGAICLLLALSVAGIRRATAGLF
ncbi:MAG: marine proteobacterial sortase target protein [Gammaproteobacteria bacterium]